MPSHLDFFNYADTESIPSFPGTPRQSQDGSRPATPISTLFSSLEPKGNGRQFKEKIELPSRASSSDRELSVENNDLGVKPLVCILQFKIFFLSCVVPVKPVSC